MKTPPPQPTQWPHRAIFTVGHSTLSIERFISLLKTYVIERLTDVRTVPRSRHNPQFNADGLRRALAQQNIEYVPLQALGGLRHARKDSINTGWRNTESDQPPWSDIPCRSPGVLLFCLIFLGSDT